MPARPTTTSTGQALGGDAAHHVDLVGPEHRHVDGVEGLVDRGLVERPAATGFGLQHRQQRRFDVEEVAAGPAVFPSAGLAGAVWERHEVGLGQHDVGETFHSPCGQGVAQHAGEGDGDLVAGEGGVPLDERCGDMRAEVVDGGHLLDELSGAGILDPDDDRFGPGGGDRDAAAAAPRPPPATLVGGADGAGEQLVDVVGSVADGGGFGVPAGIEGLAVELVLAGPGRQRGLGGRRRTGLAEPFELVVDLVATLREQRQHPAWGCRRSRRHPAT